MSEAGGSDLIALAQRGDVEAIGALYDQHHAPIFRYLWSRVWDRQAAEDLTGEVFLRMLAALPRYRPSQTPFRAWLYRIARNLLVDHYRQMNKRVLVPLEVAKYGSEDGGDPAALLEDRLTITQVQRALSRLQNTQREVVSLRILGGLSLQEVATALGKSVNAVKAAQHRGLAALRQALSREEVLP